VSGNAFGRIVRLMGRRPLPVLAVTLLLALGGAALARSTRLERRPWLGASPYARLALGSATLALMVVPTLVAVSQRHLNRSVAAFGRQDCAAASREARSAISTLSVRAEPYEILGYCEIRQGRPRHAIAEIRKAVDRDPRNWNYHYSLAVARGAAGLDPRPEARRARRMNPLEPLTRDLVQRFHTDSRRAWVRSADDVARSLESL
jgi:tetratricopeptide (TPR) repeat protein